MGRKRKRKASPMQGLSLLADIGGTNARFALSESSETAPHDAHAASISGVRILPCADYPSLEAAAEAYLALEAPGARPKQAAIALAGPVTGDRIRMTNLPWEFSIDGVRRSLSLDRLEVVNDFTAVALSIPALGANDRAQVGDGAPVADAPIAVLGPGSGLGVSSLIPRKRSNGQPGWTALATEGGHVTMAPVNDRESAILGVLRKQFDHVSAERVLSGPGLVNLYEAVCLADGKEPARLTAAQVTAAGTQHAGDPACIEALETFCGMLGTVAGNLALSIGARGGVYIAGGIAPRILSFFTHSRFRKRFVEKGRMRDYLGPIPTYVVTHPLPAFLGLTAKLDG
ncbi:glucokinase [Nitrospirillum amazonense]|nr:glucokinase [Nitrospirillum amazonense]